MTAANRKGRCRRLALEIERSLQSGILLTPGTLHFMASTYAVETPRELETLLSDPDDSELQPLLALFFSPDETTQMELEEIIEKKRYTALDEQVVIDLVAAKQVRVPLRFPEHADNIVLSPSQHLLETYVSNLKITRSLPAKLLGVIHESTGNRLANAIKVKLRNARVELSQPACAFLGRLVTETGTTRKEFLPDLDLCLALFSENPETLSLFDLFMGKKRRLLTALQQAERFEKQLARDNIETLMLRGVRAAHIDKVATRRQIARIDALCLSVFGVTDPLLQVPTPADLGNITNRGDLDKAFEILS